MPSTNWHLFCYKSGYGCIICTSTTQGVHSTASTNWYHLCMKVFIEHGCSVRFALPRGATPGTCAPASSECSSCIYNYVNYVWAFVCAELMLIYVRMCNMVFSMHACMHAHIHGALYVRTVALCMWLSQTHPHMFIHVCRAFHVCVTKLGNAQKGRQHTVS